LDGSSECDASVRGVSRLVNSVERDKRAQCNRLAPQGDIAKRPRAAALAAAIRGASALWSRLTLA